MSAPDLSPDERAEVERFGIQDPEARRRRRLARIGDVAFGFQIVGGGVAVLAAIAIVIVVLATR